MRLALALLVAMTACTTELPDAPHVQVELTDPDAWSPEELGYVRGGFAAWSDLGFTFELVTEYQPSEVPCDRHWRVAMGTECTIEVMLTRYAGLFDRYGADGLADRDVREVVIDAKHTGWQLAALIAHEGGHVILDTGHLDPGVVGVMASGNTTIEPTAADYARACDSIGICI